MSCSFTLLGLSRRPLLSEEEIGIAYRKLARELHPDQTSGDAIKFREIGEAAAILRSSARRLKELAGGNFENQLPVQAADIFLNIAEILQKSDSLITQSAAASSPLSKALLAAPRQALAKELYKTLDSLHQWQSSLNQELARLDEAWPEIEAIEMNQLANSFSYAAKWTEQLRERELSLASFLP